VTKISLAVIVIIEKQAALNNSQHNGLDQSVTSNNPEVKILSSVKNFTDEYRL
jgi:hypothetical protein